MLADDEMALVRLVQRIVQDMDFEFCYATDGIKAIDVFKRENPDLVILDVMMPRLDGYDVCEIIRQKSDVPIIFLTAKSDIMDKTLGYKLGGDDYITKPFVAAELELRLRALLKRNAPIVKSNDANEIFVCDELRIDFATSEVSRNGEKIHLSMTEFTLLQLLARSSGQTFTRNQITEALWGKDFFGEENTITVFIRKLREKIEPTPSKPRFLITVWGIGYMLKEGEFIS